MPAWAGWRIASVGVRSTQAAAHEVVIASSTVTFSSASSAGRNARMPGALPGSAQAERNGVVNSRKPARIRVRWVGLSAPSRLVSMPRTVCQVRSPAAPARKIANPTSPSP